MRPPGGPHRPVSTSGGRTDAALPPVQTRPRTGSRRRGGHDRPPGRDRDGGLGRCLGAGRGGPGGRRYDGLPSGRPRPPPRHPAGQAAPGRRHRHHRRRRQRRHARRDRRRRRERHGHEHLRRRLPVRLPLRRGSAHDLGAQRRACRADHRQPGHGARRGRRQGHDLRVHGHRRRGGRLRLLRPRRVGQRRPVRAGRSAAGVRLPHRRQGPPAGRHRPRRLRRHPAGRRLGRGGQPDGDRGHRRRLLDGVAHGRAAAGHVQPEHRSGGPDDRQPDHRPRRRRRHRRVLAVRRPPGGRRHRLLHRGEGPLVERRPVRASHADPGARHPHGRPRSPRPGGPAAARMVGRGAPSAATPP